MSTRQEVPLGRLTALMLTLSFASACVTWQPVDRLTPETFISTEHPAQIRAVFAGGYEYAEINKPYVFEGKLYGWQDGKLMSGPLYEVQRVEVRKVDAAKTTVGILGVGTLIFLLTEIGKGHI